jgi:hypothetical protein
MLHTRRRSELSSRFKHSCALSGIGTGPRDGNFNAEINLTKTSTSRTICVEKLFKAEDVANNMAAREIVVLRDLHGRHNINIYEDHYLDQSTGHAAIFTKFYEHGSL